MLTRVSLLDADGRGLSPEDAARVESLLDEADAGGGERLRCGFCGHPITARSSRLEVDGAHEHRRINPAGFVYRIGCFRAAPGCTAEGEPTEHWSWFPGYAWQVALCRSCRGHLGWAFRMESSAFYGLIVTRLVAGEDQGPAA